MPHEAAVLIGLGQSGMVFEASLDRGKSGPIDRIAKAQAAAMRLSAVPDRDICGPRLGHSRPLVPRPTLERRMPASYSWRKCAASRLHSSR